MSQDQLAVLTEQICPKASPTELELFLTVCQRTGLDPFSKQIYGLKRKQWDADAGQNIEKLSIQISVDGLRTIAQRSGQYEGQTMPQFCGPDGVWRDVWFGNDYPVAARVGVWRKGFREPLFGVVTFQEFAQRKRDGKLTSMWEKMPTTMLAKCAESQALRKAFPHETASASEEVSDLEPHPAQVTGGPGRLALEGGATYQNLPAHKRALRAAVLALGKTEFDTPNALREIAVMCVGVPLAELEMKVAEVLGEDPEAEDPAEAITEVVE